MYPNMKFSFQFGPYFENLINIFIIKMNSAYPLEENNKDTSEDMLKKIVDENSILNSMNFNLLNQVLSAFKITDNNSGDTTEKLKKIKQKLFDIIIDQKEQCVHYLTLPKFKNMSESSKTALRDAMNQIWKTYQKNSIEEEKNKRCTRYFCRTDDLKQCQFFQLQLFHFIKNSYFPEHPSYFRPPMGNFHMMPPGVDFSGYPGMQMPQMPQMPPQMPGGMMPAPQYYGIPLTGPGPGPGSIKIQQKDVGSFQPSYSYREELPAPSKVSKKNYNSDQNFQTKNSKQDKDSSLAPIYKSFMNCACKGKRPETERFFQCNDCKKKYHLACLNIPTYAVEKPGVQKQCPQCSLKNTNALFSVIGEPLETFWSDDRELHKQKITIKSKKCKQILEKKYSIQLKFIKIQGRCMYDWDGATSVKQEPNAVTKPKKTILNEVLIKDEVLNKGSGQDVKISLDCMKGPDDNKNQQRKPVLLFVALNIVKQKTLPEILHTPYEYFDDDYLDKFFKDKEQIKIEILDSQFKLINMPVRGIDCEHYDLFDLQQFASHCIDLHTDQCFNCSKRCRTFKIDRKVQTEIKKIKQMIPDPSKYPHAIYYKKDGSFRWHEQKKPMEEERKPMSDSEEEEEVFPDLDVSMGSDDDNEDNDDDDDDDDGQSKSKNNKNSKTIKIKKQPKN